MEHASHVWAHNVTQGHKPVLMYALFLHVQAQNPAKLDQITDLKVSMESQKYFPHILTGFRSPKGARYPKKIAKHSNKSQRPQAALCMS